MADVIELENLGDNGGAEATTNINEQRVAFNVSRLPTIPLGENDERPKKLLHLFALFVQLYEFMDLEGKNVRYFSYNVII